MNKSGSLTTWIVLALLLIVIAALQSVAMHALFSSQVESTSDFYSR